MQTRKVPKGDFGYKIPFTLYDEDGTTVVDLSGYSTVKIKVWEPGYSGTLLVDAAVALVGGGTTGQCEYTVQSGDFDVVGTFYAEIEATTGATLKESWETFKIVVEESG